MKSPQKNAESTKKNSSFVFFVFSCGNSPYGYSPDLVRPGTPLVRLWYTLKPQKRSMVPGFGTPGTPCGRGVGGWPRRMSLGSALPFPSKPNQDKESEAIGGYPKLSEPTRTLKMFLQCLLVSSHRKILTYDNLQQPTTTYNSLKIFLAPDLCLTRSRPNRTKPEQSRPIQTKNIAL